MDLSTERPVRMTARDANDGTLIRRKDVGVRVPGAPVLVTVLAILVIGGCHGLHSPATIQADGFSIQAGKSRYLMEKGVKHYQRGELPLAAMAFEQSIVANPTNAAAHNNLGLVRYEQHQLFHAATHFESAAELRPSDPRPLNNLGMTLEAGGKGVEAIEYYLLANELAPTDPLYLGNLIRTRIRLGETDESVIAQLKELRFVESRPEWIEWIDRQLALELNPYLDRGPSVQLASGEGSDPLSPDRDRERNDYNPVLLDGSDLELNQAGSNVPTFGAGDSMLMTPSEIISP